MGADPKTSVINRYLQMLGRGNLFVMGGAAFPQNAGHNPTGTVDRRADLLVCAGDDFAICEITDESCPRSVACRAPLFANAGSQAEVSATRLVDSNVNPSA